MKIEAYQGFMYACGELDVKKFLKKAKKDFGEYRDISLCSFFSKQSYIEFLESDDRRKSMCASILYGYDRIESQLLIICQWEYVYHWALAGLGVQFYGYCDSHKFDDCSDEEWEHRGRSWERVIEGGMKECVLVGDNFPLADELFRVT